MILTGIRTAVHKCRRFLSMPGCHQGDASVVEAWMHCLYALSVRCCTHIVALQMWAELSLLWGSNEQYFSTRRSLDCNKDWSKIDHSQTECTVSSSPKIVKICNRSNRIGNSVSSSQGWSISPSLFCSSSGGDGAASKAHSSTTALVLCSVLQQPAARRRARKTNRNPLRRTPNPETAIP